MPSSRTYDIVVFGASGFVGRLLAEHLAANAPADVRIALAGRSGERLRAVRAGLGAAASTWPLLVIDAGDARAVDDMAAQTRVVATTVGPYARYGAPVVAACAERGTDYVDLSGELLFVRDSADRQHDRARRSGARIVHSCGFDSVPSDISVLLAAQAAAADATGALISATLALRAGTGGFSGGTIDSLRSELDEIAADPALRGIAKDPYALSPARAAEPDVGPQPSFAAPSYDAELRMWIGPFVMAPYNTRIVRRSNALYDWGYGRRLRYREVVGFGRGPTRAARAFAMAAGLAALTPAMRFGPTRSVLDRVLPDPGEGPDRQTRERGYFRMELHARTVTGARYRVTFGAQGDPGYAATSVMMGESALALVLDRDALPDTAGVLTPASGIGAVLSDRLRAAGFDIRVERDA